MSTDIIEVKRGSTLSLAFKIPDSLPDNYFENWLVGARIRRHKLSGNRGLIADLQFYWINPEHRALMLFHNITDSWPIGPAELDIKFTSPNGFQLFGKTLPVKIIREITDAG